MGKKRGLGKGLGALIPLQEATDAAAPAGGVPTVPIKAIQPNPRQPRSNLDSESLAELAASIQAHGLLQPIIVTQAGDGRYTLIAGERRWRAAQLAGLEAIPAIVQEATPQALLELALVENLQRADLNPLEEALAYRQLMDEFGLTQEEVARRVGKSRSAVANTVRLVELPAEVQRAVVDGRLSEGHARALLSLPSAEAQLTLMRSIMQHEWSVRQTEEVVKKLLTEEKPPTKPPKTIAPELADLAGRFEQSLGTRVTIEKGNKGGKVVIHFYSDEELQAIYEAIVKEA
ncbi:MAG: ParB/RepB/Spo0J family partition protein [Chloroflexota bacterium]